MRNIHKFLAIGGFFAIILISMWSFTSQAGFLDPIKWQIEHGYNENVLPPEASFSERIRTIESKIEASFNNVNGKYNYIQLNGLTQRLLGRHYIYDLVGERVVIKLNNGYLTNAFPKLEQNVIDDRANKVIALNEKLKQKGIGLIYLSTPYKVSKYDKQLPIGIEDYTNENTDEFLSKLKSGSVDYMDLREELRIDGKNPYESFFITDHHWKPETGLWAFGKVGKHLNDKYGFNIDTTTFDPNNYNYDVVKDVLLGSHGKRIGTLYAGADDLTLITPKFKTNLEMSVPSNGELKSGEFKDTIFYNYRIENVNYFDSNPYYVYLGNDYPLQVIKNKLVSDKKILLVRDSFGAVAAPFLALGCSELDIIDLRAKTQSLLASIEQINPDVVIFVYSPPMIADSWMYDF